MPLPPYTWQNGDYITAGRLQSELRMTNGQPYFANGVSWHVQRPVFRSFVPGAPGGTTTWTKLAGTSKASWNDIVDDAAFLGSRFDIAGEGVLDGSSITNGGGALGSSGGIALAMNGLTWLSGAGSVMTGIGPTSGSSPASVGTIQTANLVNQICYALDLIDYNVPTTGWYKSFNAGPVPSNSGTGTDGSGNQNRLQAFWASVYPGNASTVSSLPTITPSWGPSGAQASATVPLLNTNIQQAMSLLNMPPVLRVTAPNATGIPSGTPTTVSYSGATATYDTYSAFNASTSTYTAPLAGLYLVCAFSGFDSAPATGAAANTGILVNASPLLQGPITRTVSGGQPVRMGKVHILSLNAGDTIKQQTYQNTGSTVSTSTGTPSMLVIVWLGYNSWPSTLPTVPDITYRFMAGTSQSDSINVFNNNIANDLLFLTQRPYSLAYQTVAQTGLTESAFTSLNLDTNAGIVHGDSAASYGGWATNTFTAPASGFYLCVMGAMMAAPSLTAAPQYEVGFQLGFSGSISPDVFQLQSAVTGQTWGGGGEAIAIYYLRAGDTISPVVSPANTSSTTDSTSVATAKSHFEAVWISG